MTRASDITAFLDDELRHHEFEDMSINGLQVEGTAIVKKIGFAVDASLETFGLAEKKGCQLLIVHHGMIWQPGMGRLVGGDFRTGSKVDPKWDWSLRFSSSTRCPSHTG